MKTRQKVIAIGAVGVVCAGIATLFTPLMVSASVSYDLQACDEDLPLNVVIRNNSFLYVVRSEIEFGAYVPGYSGRSAWVDWDIDKIISPGESSGWCVATEHSRLRDIGPANHAAHEEEKAMDWKVVDSSFQLGFPP